MGKRSRNAAARPSRWFSAVFHSRVCATREMSLFLFFSVTDLLLTVQLLRGGGHVEANPVARYILYGWGLKGLVYFKFALVAAVCTIAQIIGIKRLETARRLLSFAVLVMAAVVTYSSVLYFKTRFP